MFQTKKEEKTQSTSLDAGALDVLRDVLTESQKDNRRARRWTHFFKLLTFAYLFVLVFMFRDNIGEAIEGYDEPHVAVLKIHGAISSSANASAENINSSLREAFENEHVEAVILDINSPGGSPVQAEMVFKEIRRLKMSQPDIPVYAVIQEQGASAAYYIASAADKIYASDASLVGSIGVISAGFGYSDVMKQYGFERRVYTSGKHKAFLDPFAPEQSDEVTIWQDVLTTTHEQMKRNVKLGRGDRLSDHPDLFEGLAWTGEQSLELGLIDGIATTHYVATQQIGIDELIPYGRRPSFFEKMTSRLGASIGNAAFDQMAAQQFLPELQ